MNRPIMQESGADLFSERGFETPKLRPPRRAELLEDNTAFVELAGRILRMLRDTEDGSCACCGSPRGQQHNRRRVCFDLVKWRHATQYKVIGT